jgi:MFS family permease
LLLHRYVDHDFVLTINPKLMLSIQVFYSVGFDGMIYACDVVTADSSSLRNRGIAYGFTASPYIITAFAGPKAAEGFYEKINYRWGFGVFCILVPAVAIPLFTTLTWNQRKAKKLGVLPRERSGRSFYQSIWHYIVEFDGKLFTKCLNLHYP